MTDRPDVPPSGVSLSDVHADASALIGRNRLEPGHIVDDTGQHLRLVCIPTDIDDTATTLDWSLSVLPRRPDLPVLAGLRVRLSPLDAGHTIETLLCLNVRGQVVFRDAPNIRFRMRAVAPAASRPQPTEVTRRFAASSDLITRFTAVHDLATIEVELTSRPDRCLIEIWSPQRAAERLVVAIQIGSRYVFLRPEWHTRRIPPRCEALASIPGEGTDVAISQTEVDRVTNERMSALMLEHRDDLAWSIAHATNLPWKDLMRDRSLDPRLRDIIAAAIIEADTSEGAGT